jgi:hypothetical protein
MASASKQNPRHDPLLHDFELPLRAIYHPLGFSVEIATNCREVLLAAQESWGHFPKAFAGPLLRICIGVLDDGSASCAGLPIVRARRGLMARVADANNFSMSNVEGGFAFAWLTQATVSDKAYLRWHFIEGIAWDLLDPYLTPVHAACVRKDDCGILLCGDSGAGKTSLAYVCALNGWTYLTDDSCCLVRGEDERTVIGNPYQIRFRASAVDLFPELKDHCPKRRLNGEKVGEMAFELPTDKLPGIATTTKSSVDYVVFLNRNQDSPARLKPFSKVAAVRWLEQVICCCEKRLVDIHRAALRKLAEAPIFELCYANLGSAIQELETLASSYRRSTARICASQGDSDNV